MSVPGPAISSSGGSYALFDTAFGRCAIAWSDRGLSRMLMPDADPALLDAALADRGAVEVAPTTLARRAIDALIDYFEGRRPDFTQLDLDPTGVSAFNWRVYRQLVCVPYGETTTYGALAKVVGEPGSARAIGRAMATNPWPIIVPCHRVLAAGDRMGGFSAPGATVTKARLHALEGIVRNGQPELPGL